MNNFKKYSELKNNLNKYTIFCDMDGVLTDFEKRFKNLPGNTENLDPSEFEKKHGQGIFWKLIDEDGLEFWTDLEWMPDGQKLWSWLTPYSPTILSAPSRNPLSREGKHIWIKNHLGIKQDFYTINPSKWKPHYRIILNKNKHLFARNEYDILIDDTPKKIDAWVKAGGTGILHTSVDDTISKLEKILR